jgi:hypothetical protein
MKDDVLENAPPTGARFEPDTEVARLVETLAAVYYRIDADVDQLRRDRYVETATGVELDRRGRPLGVERPAGEGDDAFRRRALAGRARATSETTFEDFAEACLAVLDADPDQVQLTIDYADELGAVIVEATTTVIEESPFSESQIVEFLEGSLPMSRRVVLRPTDVASWGEADKGWGTQWGGDIES